MDSVFNLKRPYDLVAFLKQEERASMLEKLKKELLSRKDEIDKTDDGDSGIFFTPSRGRNFILSATLNSLPHNSDF